MDLVINKIHGDCSHECRGSGYSAVVGVGWRMERGLMVR